MTESISNKQIYEKTAIDYLQTAAETKTLINEYEEKRKRTKRQDPMYMHYEYKLMGLYMVYNECRYKAKKLYDAAEKVNS